MNVDAIDLLILVDRDHPLPEGFVPDLVDIEGTPDMRCDRRCTQDLARLLAASEDAGFRPEIKSAYRGEKAQKGCFAHVVDRLWGHGMTLGEALEEARRFVATPGCSEHQTGLAFDIKDEGYKGRAAGLEGAPGQRWLMSHCHEFGFILRYPPDKEHVTHVAFEPCHFRYVGKGHAAEIAKRGMTLEEYVAPSTAAKAARLPYQEEAGR